METMKPVDGRHLSGSIAAALALCAHSAMSFSPPDLEDLALWLDASVAESIEIESGSVAAWNDARGGVAGGFQDSEAARPAIATENDLPAVVFTGTAWLDTTYEYLSRSDTRASVFVVAKSTAPEQTGFLLHSDGSQSTRSRQGFSIVWIDGAGDVVLGGGLNAFEDTPDGDNIIGASWDNSAGEGLTLANGWMQPASVNGAYTSNRLQIGARSSGDIPWTGHLRELLVFERDLTPDNCRRVEGYLAHKWDLAGNLPEEHPYKEAPPQGVLFTKTTPFQIADPTTGSTAFTGSNKVTLLDFPIPEGYDHYQLTFGQNDPAGIVPEDWQFTNSLPTVLTFERPALNADISFVTAKVAAAKRTAT